MHLVLVGAAITGAGASPVDAADAARQREDDLFLRNLTERQLHNLAEHHCRDMRNRAPAADDRVKWQLRLAAVYEQHAWFADAASRQELLNQCVSELNEYSESHQASPELELQLRFQQVRIIRTSVRIAFVMTSAGHLTAADRINGLPAEVPSAAPAEHLNNVRSGIELIEKSVQQLENIRSELPPKVVRTLREDARLLLAELYLLKSQFHHQDEQQPAEQDRKQAAELLNLILRSAGNPDTKYRARWFLAELFLLSGSDDEFEAQIRLIQSLRRTSTLPLPEFLTVRHLLRQQKAERAGQLLAATVFPTALGRQQREWLRLESLLVLRQLVEQLDDTQLIAETTQQFAKARERALASTTGVYSDAVDLVIRRFELIEAVGVAVADLIEQVDRRRSQGKGEEALRLIDLTLQQLPPIGSDQSRAALQLHAGEVLIDMKRWQAAHQRLTESARLFGVLERASAQATADLLNIFTLAQMLTNGNSNVSKQHYVQALEQHLQQFPGMPTIGTARQWLLQIIETDRPNAAVDLLQTMLSDEFSIDGKFQLLEHIGRLLTSMPPTDATQIQIAAFQSTVQALMENETAPSAATAVVRFYALELNLKSGEAPDWESLQQQLTAIKADLDLLPDTTPALKSVRRRYALIDTVVVARTRQGVTRDNQRQAVLQLPPEQRSSAVEFLYSHYAGPKLMAGDQWLAQISDALLRQLILHPAPPEQQAQWLRIASRNATLTGNADVRNQILDAISRLQLSPEQLQGIAEAMSDSPAKSDADRKVTDKASLAARSSFWKQVLAASSQGSDAWLEASLRLAGFAAVAGDTAAARRQLGVVETLYPEWGSDERRRRAQKLMSTLNP